ncbi:C-_U-editing enzyme APOBEC-2 isoform 2-T2 [Rhinophrynus dorsalis]
MAQKQSKTQSLKVPEDPPQNEDKSEKGVGESNKGQEKLSPFEIVKGSRISASSFKFQFKNVEYSSGRNKTLLCYTVERGEGQVYCGYVEDEHAFAHAEEAFFTTILPQFLTSGPVSIICYVSSSPCVGCAACIAQCLKKNKALNLCLAVARLFQWEEPEIRLALRGLQSAGCKLRMMGVDDFSHVWKNFVEPDTILDQEGIAEERSEQEAFIPWDDLEENSRVPKFKME